MLFLTVMKDLPIDLNIVNRREGLETHNNIIRYNIVRIIIYVGQGLCEYKVLHRHVCIVFLPIPPIAILELPNCLNHEWLTFLKRCYWLVRQEYNKHVTMKVFISA